MHGSPAHAQNSARRSTAVSAPRFYRSAASQNPVGFDRAATLPAAPCPPMRPPQVIKRQSTGTREVFSVGSASPDDKTTPPVGQEPVYYFSSAANTGRGAPPLPF